MIKAQTVVFLLMCVALLTCLYCRLAMQSYTSFMAPVTSHKLYNDVKAYKDLEHFETPYVVKFHKWVTIIKYSRTHYYCVP